MPAPRLSVVIPVLNEQDLLGLAIDSVSEAAEVIVVDGGSSDASATLARQRGCIVLETPPGRGHQLQTGAARASGDTLVFLHADCRLAAGWTRQIETALAHHHWGCFEQRIDGVGRRFRWLEQGNAWRARRRRLVYGDQCLWIRRPTYDSCGGFCDVPLMEDVLISDRLRQQGGPPVILPGPVHLTARGWSRRGVVRQTARNWILFALFRCGVSPQRLADWYRNRPAAISDRDAAGLQKH